jgi:hypothetical protein
MIGIPLDGAATVPYYLVERPGLRSQGVDALRKLILETVP